MAKTWRDEIRQRSPSWLRTGVAEKLLYAIAIQADALTDGLVAAVKARFPGVYTPESLPLIGRERRIRRGPSDTDQTYAARLMRWRIDHRTRGNPYAMLRQIFAYYAPANFKITLVHRSGRTFTMTTGGTITRGLTTWNNGPAARWARWWLIYDWPTAVPPAHDLDDVGYVLDDSTVLDSGLTVDEVYDVRVVPQDWNAAHAQGSIVLRHNAVLLDFPPAHLNDVGLVLDGGSTAVLGVN